MTSIDGPYYNDFVSILAWLLLCVTFLALPYHSYYVYKFWKHRNSVALLRRYPYYVLGFDAVLILFTYVYAVYHVLLLTIQCIDAPEWTTWFLFGFCCYGISWMFALRAWLLYFDYGYHTALSNCAWAQEIGGDFAQTDWFLNNHRTWGNPKFFFLRIVLPCWLVSEISFTFVSIFTTGESDPRGFKSILFSTNAVLCFFPWAFVFLLWYKMRYHDVQDFFSIRPELVAGAIVTFTCIGFYLLDHIVWLLAWGHNERHYWQMSDRVSALIYGFLCMAWGQCHLIFATSRVLRVNSEYLGLRLTQDPTKKGRPEAPVSPKGAQSQLMAHVQMAAPAQQDMLSVSGQTGENTKAKQMAFSKEHSKLIVTSSFEEYISHKRGFQLFMAHLVKEFSMENLLFMVELNQWKAHLKRNHISRKEFQNHALERPLKFPSNVPQPELIRKHEKPFDQGLALYDKYCNPKTALHWVNLRGSTLRELKKFWQNAQKQGNVTNASDGAPMSVVLYQLFDKSDDDIMKLLRGSWERFQNSAAYESDKGETTERSRPKSSGGGGSSKKSADREPVKVVISPQSDEMEIKVSPDNEDSGSGKGMADAVPPPIEEPMTPAGAYDNKPILITTVGSLSEESDGSSGGNPALTADKEALMNSQAVVASASEMDNTILPASDMDLGSDRDLGIVPPGDSTNQLFIPESKQPEITPAPQDLEQMAPKEIPKDRGFSATSNMSEDLEDEALYATAGNGVAVPPETEHKSSSEDAPVVVDAPVASSNSDPTEDFLQVTADDIEADSNSAEAETKL